MQNSRLHGTYCQKPLLYEARLVGSTGGRLNVNKYSPSEGDLWVPKLDLWRLAML